MDTSTSEKFKFWMVWREGTPSTRHRHYSRSEATREAERLAKNCPGETLYVMKSVEAMTSESQPVKRVKLVKCDDIPF